MPNDQIDPIYYAKSYYLEPEKNAVKPYVLLRDALLDSDMVGLVKVAIRNREQLATLRVRDGVIVLTTMIWPDEVREADFGFLDEDIELRSQEQQMARSLRGEHGRRLRPRGVHRQLPRGAGGGHRGEGRGPRGRRGRGGRSRAPATWST